MAPVMILLALLLSLLPSGIAHAQDADSFSTRLDRILDSGPLTQRTRVAVYVLDPQSGRVLYDRFGKQLFTPASVLKTYTSACALDTFGPDHTFTTKIVPKGEIVDGVLKGDLVLVGGGDPMFTHEDLASLAARVKSELGITRIDGNVIVDESLFDSPLKGPGWMWDDDPDTYNMSIGAAMMDYNVLRVVVQPSGNPGAVTASLSPPSDYPKLQNLATIGDKNTLKVERRPFEETIKVVGTITSDQALTSESLTMHNPALWVASVLRRNLEDNGVSVAGVATTDECPLCGENERWARQHVLLHPSQPLSAAIRRFNKVSENAVGEMLIHQLAIAGGAKPATWPTGADFVSKWLREKPGLTDQDFRIVDGSGLSRYNLVCPEGTVRLLAWMRNHEHFAVYKDSLPVYTVTLPDGKREQRVSAKPGGMSGVSTLAGYVDTIDGKQLVFAVFANGYLGENTGVVALRNRIMNELAAWKGE